MHKLSVFKTILFAVFGMAAVIGIFVFATHTAKNSSGPATVGTVVIWGTQPAADMQATLVAATKKDQSLKDVSYVQKSPDTLAADLASAIATGNAPDLILTSQEQLHPLAKLIPPIPTSTLPPATFNAAFVRESNILATPTGDGYYGVPFLIDPLVLYSNRAILASDGIAKPPATWESLTGLVPNVAVLTPTKQVTRSLIALGSYDNVHNARGILSTLFMQTGVPMSSYAPGGAVAADLTGVASGESPGRAVLDFYTQFADPSKVSYTWNASLPDSLQAFLNGDVALYLGYISETKFIKAANPNLDFAVSVIPQPGTATNKSVYGLLYSFMTPRGSKNPSGAYQAAALLSNSDMQTIASTITGLAPASLTALSTQPTAPLLVIAYGEALYAKGWLSPSPSNTDAVFSSMITGVISGRLTLDTALNAASSALSGLLQK